MVGILLGVELVHEGRLLVLSLVAVTGTGGAGGGGGVRAVVLEISLTLADALTKGLATSGVGVGTSKTGAGVGRTSDASAGETGAGGVRATNGAGLTLEAIVALLTASQDTALLLEVGHRDGGKSRGGVVLGSVVVNLVDGDGGVDNVRLNGLLVDNGLDGLVDVVVDVLTADGGGNGLGVDSLDLSALVSELGSLGSKALLDLGVVAVLERAVLDGGKVVVVLLGKNLTVLDGLDRGVVVVLVNLLVDGSLDLLVLLELMALVGDSRSDLLVDGGVVVTRLGPEERCEQTVRMVIETMVNSYMKSLTAALAESIVIVDGKDVVK
jgi:hypothetical protein